MTKTLKNPELTTKQILEVLLTRIRRIKGFYFFIMLSLATACLLLLLNPLPVGVWSKTGLTLLIFAIASAYFFRSKKYRDIIATNLLEDINRQFPKYQESAQLLAFSNRDSDSEDQQQINQLSTIQCIQKDTVEQLLLSDYQQGLLFEIGSKVNLKLPAMLFLMCLIFYIGKDRIKSLYAAFETQTVIKTLVEQNGPLTQMASNLPRLTKSNVKITPPAYTKLSPRNTQSLNLEVPEGSQVLWTLEFTDSESNYYYRRSGQTRMVLSQTDHLFQVSEKINRTSLYRLSFQNQQQQGHLEGVYSIAILRDQAPKIKIIHPIQTLVEIKQTDKPEFILEAKISDDYGISDVKILASVAKGSGEAVKFRDKVFRFSQSEQINHNSSRNSMPANSGIYRKNWSLINLDMEPGDEVYFSIVASDNKQPHQQTSKSSSIIVRWLDEQEFEMAAEGIKIRFVPEYFRSQRQIIIETEQLIADKKDLNQTNFSQISTDLGHSQSDLKQKYGQYLGDEIGEGPGEQFGLADGYHGGKSHDAGEAQAQNSGIEHDAETEHHQKTTHNHDVENTASDDQTDLSGAAQLIQQFTHNHGTIEIGPMSARDPKSWMKMAVNEMWQAELHLMLSAPEKALPYEYEAYNYLKKAQQAERIYAKRLGFEPPPVTEERRLTGELSKILNNDLSFVVQRDNNADSRLIEKAYQIIKDNQYRLADKPLSKHQLVTFSSLSTYLLALAEERPVLIKYASIAEQIALTKSLLLKQCEQCISNLKDKLWQLFPKPISSPATLSNYHGLSDQIELEYIQALQGLGENND